MKGRSKIFCVAFLALFWCIPVWADVGFGQKTDYHTDYYMVVESKSGGVHLYADADTSTARLNQELILNGTSLHIRGEKKDGAGRAWGLTEYHGMNGFVQLDELKPVTLTEAIQSEFSEEEIKDVDYEQVVSSEEESVKVYRGPGKKFGEISSAAIKKGETVHISKEVLTKDEELWGKVAGREKNGWIKMDKKIETVDMSVPEEEPKETSVETVDGISGLFMNPVLWIAAAGIFLVLVFLYFLKLK